MSAYEASLTRAVAELGAWDGEDPGPLDGLVTAAADAVRAFAREVPPAETRGPDALAMMAGANAGLARALSRVVAREARATALGEAEVGAQLRACGARLQEATAQLARETAARVGGR